jgi:hypothetical protein
MMRGRINSQLSGITSAVFLAAVCIGPVVTSSGSGDTQREKHDSHGQI